MRFIDLTGQKIHKLKVLERVNNVGRKGFKWRCLCDCGKEILIVSTVLIRKTTKSCGCIRSEVTSTIKFKHGNSLRGKVTPEYKCWQNIKRRCSDESNKEYHNYGGRGIKVCDRWEESFSDFIEDMGPKPSPKYSLDRIDVDGNYEPLNCRWTTMTEQNRNRRVQHRNTCGTPGIEWCEKISKWRVKITANYKRIGLGSYSNFEEAVRVRKDAELKYWNKSS